jgi:hypothetical protein
MNRSHTHRASPRIHLRGRLAILLLPVALVVGCSDSSNNPPTATATPVPAATNTAAPPATVTATRPAATNTPATTNTPAPTLTPTAATNADARAACQKLATCGQCFSNQYGNCLTADDCAARLVADLAICVNALSSCDQQALGDCLFLGCDGDASGECG